MLAPARMLPSAAARGAGAAPPAEGGVVHKHVRHGVLARGLGGAAYVAGGRWRGQRRRPLLASHESRVCCVGALHVLQPQGRWPAAWPGARYYSAVQDMHAAPRGRHARPHGMRARPLRGARWVHGDGDFLIAKEQLLEAAGARLHNACHRWGLAACGVGWVGWDGRTCGGAVWHVAPTAARDQRGLAAVRSPHRKSKSSMRWTGFCLKLKKMDWVSLLKSWPIAWDAMAGARGCRRGAATALSCVSPLPPISQLLLLGLDEGFRATKGNGARVSRGLGARRDRRVVFRLATRSPFARAGSMARNVTASIVMVRGRVLARARRVPAAQVVMRARLAPTCAASTRHWPFRLARPRKRAAAARLAPRLA
jgi:hypothetical protein